MSRVSTAVDARVLAVEIGAARVKAALARGDGTVEVVTFDGVQWLPAEVFVAPDGVVLAGAAARRHAAGSPAGMVAPVPALARQSVPVNGRLEDPARLVTVLARAVTDRVIQIAGGVPARVVAVVPADWGPQRTVVLRTVLSQAGLGRVDLVEAPVAVGRYLLTAGCAVPDGTALVVGNAGDRFEACLLRRTGDGFDRVTGIVTPQRVGARIDGALAAAIGLDPARIGPAQLAWRAQAIRESLSAAPSVTIRAASGAAQVVTVDELRQAAGPVVADMVAVTRAAIDTADLPTGTPVWIVLTGGGARMPVLANAFERGLGIRPRMVTDPDLATVYGALHTPPGPDTVRATPALPPAPVQDPDTVGSWLDTTGFIAAAVSAAALYMQFASSARYYGPPSAPGTAVITYWGGLGAASVMAGLTCVIGALLFTAARHLHSRDPRVRRQLMAAALGGGAVTALVVAAAAGAVIAGSLNLPPGGFLRWSIWPVLPLTVAAATAGGMILWRPDPPPGGWLAWLRVPAAAVVLLGAGQFLIGYDLTGVPAVLAPLWRPLELGGPGLQPISLIGRIGAGAVGAGIALLILRRWWLQLPAGLLLAVLLAATLTPSGADIIAAGAAAAVAGWWLWRAIYLLLRQIILPTPTPAGPAHPGTDPGSSPAGPSTAGGAG